MKTIRPIALIIIAVIAIAWTMLGSSNMNAQAAAGVIIKVAPVSLTTLKGITGGQHVSALSVKDQTGRDDSWNKYVEFLTPNVVYTGYQNFKLPSYVSASNITSMKLTVNFRGSIKSVQTWTWQIYNWSAGGWITLGNNSGAEDWVWKQKTFNVPAPYPRFVNATRQIRIRLMSNNAVDDLDLDYEAFTITYNGTAPTPTLVPTPTPIVSRWNPSIGMTWQWDLNSPIDTSFDVDVYDVDLFESSADEVAAIHAGGAKTICYISAGSWEDWRPDAGDFPASVIGNDYAGWPGEKWLDIRKIDLLAPIMRARLDLCKSKGFDAVEPDNIEGYLANTGFSIGYYDQIRYNIWFANEAHARGLSIALKNDSEQAIDLLDYFDFGITEDCFHYNWCAEMSPLIDAGKPVFAAEYTDLTTTTKFTNTYCPQAATLQFSAILKHRNLDAWRLACP